MTFKYKVGIYVGRFQPIHVGHLKTIEVMSKLCEKIIISIGSANRPKAIDNPFSEYDRNVIINNAVVDYFKSKDVSERISYQYISDYKYNDNKWAAEVYTSALLHGATSSKDTCLFGHFKDDSSYYLNMFPQWSLHTVINYKDINATDIRDDFFTNKKLSQESLEKLMPSTIYELNQFIEKEQKEDSNNLFDEYTFLQGYKSAWKTAPYMPTFTTVDALVVKSGHVLLVQRGRNPGKGLYALPGGFLNPGEYIKNGIIRELKEETKIKVSKEELELRRDQNPISVFDHPKRSKRGRTITHVGLIDLGNGSLPEVKAADDAANAVWVPLSMIHRMSDKMFEDHFDIIVSLTSKF